MPLQAAFRAGAFKVILYLITNKINGRQYVGITITTLKQRWSQHKANSKGRLKLAFKKYGYDAFEIQQIASCIGNAEDLKELEKTLIAQYDTYNKGYNCTLGGEGSVGYRFTPEQNKANSLRQIGTKRGSYKPRTEEHSQAISIALTGKKQSPERAEKSRINALGNKSRTGMINSKEARLKASLALKGKKKPEGHGEAVRQGRLFKRQQAARFLLMYSGF